MIQESKNVVMYIVVFFFGHSLDLREVLVFVCICMLVYVCGVCMYKYVWLYRFWLKNCLILWKQGVFQIIIFWFNFYDFQPYSVNDLESNLVLSVWIKIESGMFSKNSNDKRNCNLQPPYHFTVKLVVITSKLDWSFCCRKK